MSDVEVVKKIVRDEISGTSRICGGELTPTVARICFNVRF